MALLKSSIIKIFGLNYMKFLEEKHEKVIGYLGVNDRYNPPLTYINRKSLLQSRAPYPLSTINSLCQDSIQADGSPD